MVDTRGELGDGLVSGLGFDVVLGGELKDLCRWDDLRRGRLQIASLHGGRRLGDAASRPLRGCILARD